MARGCRPDRQRASVRMSHIPLLARHAPPPRLQPPPRAPRVICVLLLLGVVLLVTQPPLYEYAYNATHAHEEPPPPELYRLLAGTRWESTANFGGMQTLDGSAVSADYLRDLLVTVRYLAGRALPSR